MTTAPKSGIGVVLVIVLVLVLAIVLVLLLVLVIEMASMTSTSRSTRTIASTRTSTRTSTPPVACSRPGDGLAFFGVGPYDPIIMTHRTILVLETPFLDAANFGAAEAAFLRFLSRAAEGAKIAVDFGRVEYISDVWPILPMGRPESRVPGHVVVCIGLSKKLCEVLSCLGSLETPGYEYIEEDVCPACRGPFNHARSTCAKCGRFEVERFTWRPPGPVRSG